MEPQPEFARAVEVPRAVGREATHTIAANEAERTALAERFSLLTLDRLEAEVRLMVLRGGMVRLSASFTAEVVQACIVTLEPVASRIEEDFTLLYGAGDDAREVVLDGEAETIEQLVDPDRHGEAVA